MNEKNIELQLSENEFIIFSEETTHIVQIKDRQAQFTPANVHITNLNIIINKQEVTTTIPITKITKFAQNIVNECAVLDVFTTSDEIDVTHIFILEPEKRLAFASILSQLCAASERGHATCDFFARKLRLQILSFDSLNDFYNHYSKLPKIDISHLTTESDHEKDTTETTIQETMLLSLKPFNFFSDLVETAPDIFFALFILFIVFSTFIFNYINFGFFVCFLLLIIILRTGLLKINRSDDSHEQHAFEMKSANPLEAFVSTVLKFQKNIVNRLLWGERAETTEVVAFFMLVLLLYTIFDPAFILALSLFGLAFFERWDPLGYGSLSTFLSHLIIW